PYGRVVVRAPLHMPMAEISRFVNEKRGWIEKHVQELAAKAGNTPPPLSAEALEAILQEAAAYLPGRAAYYARMMDARYGRIAIRVQKTRWGSCSAQGNLNFNGLLMLAPPKVRDYVVVHELCHLKHMNHSRAFWDAVGSVMPDYALQRAWLHENGRQILARVYPAEHKEDAV
ncbi:MAG: M48 family metallopeptidase, partial [Clostridia bacterium]|nr:M48 family metallopeptidase [Clostridia bacterium]